MAEVEIPEVPSVIVVALDAVEVVVVEVLVVGTFVDGVVVAKIGSGNPYKSMKPIDSWEPIRTLFLVGMARRDLGLLNTQVSMSPDLVKFPLGTGLHTDETVSARKFTTLIR